MTTAVATQYESVIGLEVHAQLLTRSKMFCSCASDYQGAPPNTRVCPVCLALPGSLPVINKRAVEFVIMTGLALNCTIPEHTKFDRKNYPYPDLMKGYQISQYDQPIAINGWLAIRVDGHGKRAGITRVHLEEDVAKLFHRADTSGETYSLLDVNRAGVPLMEIVGEPDLRSPEEARQYLVNLRAILQYLGVSTAYMEEGSFRCDANISIRPAGSRELGPKVEVKNMNSFRAVYRALEYEFVRQVQVVSEGGRIVQETRGWVEERGITVSQRSKEQAHDYRYFPEPDLPPLVVSRVWVEEVRARLPEMPEARKKRFMGHDFANKEYNLSEYDATQLTASLALANYFEETVSIFLKEVPFRRDLSAELAQGPKKIANWILTDLTSHLNARGIDIQDCPIRPSELAEFFGLIEKEHVIGTSQAKRTLEEMFKTGESARAIVDQLGLAQINESSTLEPVVIEAINNNVQALVDYLKGKDTAIKFLVGQVMRLSKGKANPQVATDLLTRNLDSLRELRELLWEDTNIGTAPSEVIQLIAQSWAKKDEVSRKGWNVSLRNTPAKDRFASANKTAFIENLPSSA